MSRNIGLYLRAQRRARDLSQADLATLLPSGSRERVSNVELGVTLPNAEEILAYSLIFDLTLEEILWCLLDDVEDAVMRGAFALNQALEGSRGPRAVHRRELTEEIRERLVSRVDPSEV